MRCTYVVDDQEANQMNSFTIPVREEIQMAFRDERDGQTSIIKDLRGKPKAQGDCILPEKPKSFAPKDRLDKELKANKSRYPP